MDLVYNLGNYACNGQYYLTLTMMHLRKKNKEKIEYESIFSQQQLPFC